MASAGRRAFLSEVALLALAACRRATPKGPSAPASRPRVTLVENGKARAAIFVSAEVMAQDRDVSALKTAARELELQRRRLRESVRDLAHYLARLSGAELEVATREPAVSDRRIPVRVGLLGESTFGPPPTRAPFRQGFRLVIRQQGIGIYGESDLATSYAIYELLDRLGCRWYMPGELGEVVPSTPTIALEELDFSSAPSTVYRGIWYSDEAFRRRNRHGGLLVSAGSGLEGYLPADVRRAHADWSAEIGGKRDPLRLKWNKPEVADALANAIVRKLEADPMPSFSVAPEDGYVFDESPEDRALDAGDFDPTFQQVSLTDRLLVLLDRIAKRVSSRWPDVLLGMTPYVNYTRAPLREKVHPNIVPVIAPIVYSRSHPMSDDRVPDNPALRGLVERWGKAARQCGFYAYAYNLAETSAPQPMIAKWSFDVPFVLRNNVRFWQPETMPNFEVFMQASYLGTRLAWDSSLSAAAVVDEIHEKFYGAAGTAMSEYWAFVDGVWTKTPEYSGGGWGYLRRWPPEKLDRARGLLDRARVACGTEMEARRVELASESLGLFERFMQMRRDLAEGRLANLAADGKAWGDRIAMLGERYKESSCFASAGRQYFQAHYGRTYEEASRLARDFELLTPTPLRRFRWTTDEEKKGEDRGWSRTDFDDRTWKVTDVCTETWSTIGRHHYMGTLWYRADIVPSGTTLRAGRTFLWIAATDGRARVFVNGARAPNAKDGKVAAEDFEGYAEPAWFDASALRLGAKNTIAIACTRTSINELGTGGLLGPVVLARERAV